VIGRWERVTVVIATRDETLLLSPDEWEAPCQDPPAETETENRLTDNICTARVVTLLPTSTNGK